MSDRERPQIIIPDREAIDTTREKPGRGIEMLYVKPGLGIGGASFCDLDLLRVCQDLGADVNLLTGFLHPRLEQLIREKYHFDVEVKEEIDRGYKGLSGEARAKKIVELMQQSAMQGNNFFLFSQTFLGDHPDFSVALAEFSKMEPTGQRVHNEMRDMQDFAGLNDRSIGLPISRVIARQMRLANKDIEIVVLPNAIDIKRFEDKFFPSEKVRENLGVAPEDFLIVQPTRVDQDKRIDRSVALVAELQKKMPNKKIHLVVAGGGEKEEKAIKEREKLETLAATLGVENLRFLGGVTDSSHKVGRIGDLMRAANLITYMSERETWGVPPAETCVVGTPCLTTRFRDINDQPVFDEVYGDFDFIVEDDLRGTGISPETVQRVLALAEDPSSWTERGANNYAKVQRYGLDAMRSALGMVFEKLDIRRKK